MIEGRLQFLDADGPSLFIPSRQKGICNCS